MRQFVAIAVVALSASSFAAEPGQFTATITVKIADNGETTEIKSKVAGRRGQPLKRELGGINDTTCAVTINDVAGSNPRQYAAAFKLTKRGNVISAPTLIALAGQEAQILVGEEEGDRIEVDFVVRDE